MKFIPLLILAFLLSGCSGLLYYPDQIIYSTPKQFKLDYEDLYFKSLDGTKLHAWHLKTKAKKRKGVVLFFHGNAQNLSSHYLSLAWMVNKDYDLLIFDYRGYGKSEGEPAPESVHLDALSALDYAHSMVKGNERYIVYAQSLGGVISLRAMMDFKKRADIDLAVFDSTFSSYEEIARDRLSSVWIFWPLQPLAYVLMDDEYASAKWIAKFDRPSLVIHSMDDPVVPYRFGKEIYEKLEAPKDMWSLKEVGHISTFHGKTYSYRKKFLEYINKKAQ